MAGVSAWLIDLTRLVLRVGHGPMTGVDRVEYQYLMRLMAGETPLFSLVATRFGQVLLDRAGTQALAARLSGEVPWGPPDLLARLTPGQTAAQRCTGGDLRRLAYRISGLGRLLRQYVPEGTRYLNLGHSNLGGASLRAVRAVPGARIVVFIHDVMPLTHRHFTKPGVAGVFGRKLRRVGAVADLVVYNSAQSRDEAEAFFAGWGRVPDGLVAHLGCDVAVPEALVLPQGLRQPYFVTVGTIEPRKNHALLLDIWERLGAAAPGLVIAGSRGWLNEDVFRRLDALPSGGAVREMAGVSDGGIAALLQNSAGLLFPSLAEGYGLPPLEAMALGVPVICNDLAVYREFLGNYPVYADASDSYLWEKAILLLAEKQSAGRQATDLAGDDPGLPTWDDHFNLVLSRA